MQNLYFSLQYFAQLSQTDFNMTVLVVLKKVEKRKIAHFT